MLGSDGMGPPSVGILMAIYEKASRPPYSGESGHGAVVIQLRSRTYAKNIKVASTFSPLGLRPKPSTNAS